MKKKNSKMNLKCNSADKMNNTSATSNSSRSSNTKSNNDLDCK